MTEETKSAEKAPTPTRTLHVWGAIGTIVWLSATLTYIVVKWTSFADLEPNAVGDFFAGAFAPLAFLWLVLGFFQQGQELRHSAEALWLQGRELQNSVEQQRELVKATREQLQFDSTMLREQQEELIRKSRPILQLTTGGSMASGTELKQNFNLTNHGRPCTDVKILVEGGNAPASKPKLDMGEVMDFRMRLARDKARYFEVIVSYIDETLRPGTKKFNVSKSAGAEGTIEIAEAN